MLHIDLKKKGITINGVFMEKIDENKFAEILGEARKNMFQGETNGKGFTRNVWIWDELGFIINIPTEDGARYSLEFELIKDTEFRNSVKYNYFDLHSKKLFNGKFTLGGKEILESFSEKELKGAYYSLRKKFGNWEISFEILDDIAQQIKYLSLKEKEEGKVSEILKNYSQPFKSFWFSYVTPKPKKVPSTKYKLSKATDTDLKFKNLTFKLAIIQELMYVQEILKPKFDVYEFCKEYTRKEIIPDDYFDEMIPEVKKWFKDLPIPASMADKITELYFDGGNEIYSQLIPQWDGEDNIYDIKSLNEEELAQFPNLKKIDGMAIFISEKTKKILKNKGIEIVED